MDDFIRERYELSMERICRFGEEESVKEPYRAYFRSVADFIQLCDKVLKAQMSGDSKNWTKEEHAAVNHALYEDILGENYAVSYANPEYAANVFGEELGKLLCFLYTEIRGDIVYAYEQRVEDMVIYNEALIEIYNVFADEEVQIAMERLGVHHAGNPAVRFVRDILYWCMSDYCDVTLTYRIREGLDPEMDFAKAIIMGSDLSDLSYLYQFGEYISEEEQKIAAFLNGLPETTIKKMADTFTDGYIRGFQVMGRDLSKKKSVVVRYPLGFERMIKEAVKNFEAVGLSVIIPRAAVGSMNRNPGGKVGYSSTSPDKQYDYDHRYDMALFMDKAFRDRKLAVLKTSYEEFKQLAADYAGPAVVEIFGEEGFAPINKDAAWSFDEKQQKLYLEYRNMSMPIVNEYIPGDETSFTIIAFPVPAIGSDFEGIFEETIEINTLDYAKYQKIQQKLIDVLDTAEYVEVIGKGENCTNMHVNLAELTDPSTQTRFENCVADVNIPVGEVFTSPKLTGTEGVLNVSSVYVGEIQFKNLKMAFENGRVTEVSCDNFLEVLPEDASEEAIEDAKIAGRKLVIQEIMNQHESLPLGEFAIGTNTTAYAMAEKYQIIDRLPILIVEKMGPHFAVGDTCYSWSEDSPMYNPDGKEMIARDNEVSILRKEDVSKAYFGAHCDITIPYKELERITVVKPDGERIAIIEKGRFVLQGLEELNVPLEK
ncbi:MAG: leucyl aminopeptidase [Lachnoclostridium sp.]|nr:leucyl aminopeptidase [Lachnoclostridium sp.]